MMRAGWVSMAIVLCVCAASPGARAQEDGDTVHLPYVLSDSAFRNTPELTDRDLRERRPMAYLPSEFFEGLRRNPRPNLETRARKTVEGYKRSAGHGPYLRSELRDGQVVIGSLACGLKDGFIVNTGLLKQRKIRYADLATVPHPVLAPAQKFIRGTETAGLVVLLVATSPIWLPITFFMCVSGRCSD